MFYIFVYFSFAILQIIYIYIKINTIVLKLCKILDGARLSGPYEPPMVIRISYLDQFPINKPSISSTILDICILYKHQSSSYLKMQMHDR